MTQTTTDRRKRSRAAARLLLSVLLALAPLLANTGGLPTKMAGGDGAAAVSTQMPCHPSEAGTALSPTAAQQYACPHCAGDGPASNCQCHGCAGPAGLSFQACVPEEHHRDGPAPRIAVTDPLPDSPGDRLYRPPITHS